MEALTPDQDSPNEFCYCNSMLNRTKILLKIGVVSLVAAWGVVPGGFCFAAPSARDDDTKRPDAADAGVFYERNVRAIFRAKCFKCHGEKKQEGGLKLSSPTGILKGGESGRVIRPGKPRNSLLIEKLVDGEMPPDKQDRLSKGQIEIIRRWIAKGARFRDSGLDGQQVTQHDVIPLVHLRCTVCHGTRRKEGGLDLRTKASMLKGGKSGPAIVPGKPAESLMLKKIKTGKMPPRRQIVSVSVKPMEPAEVELLARWIAQGAPEAPRAADQDTAEPESLLNDKDRQFWSFRTPKAVRVPAVTHRERVRNPIDAFLLRKLEPKGLSFSPEADRQTLLRRVSFDLTGLPPHPEAVESFLANADPLAYERLIDRLLSSPRYGERWGRYWLDLAGYSDSEGIQHSDIVRPFAYRYRDYVIQALNSDKPYDRFLLEQIAGDELADYENAKVITGEIYDNLVATAFLRFAADGTYANITNFALDRQKVIAHEFEILGSAVMGLTFKCVRCHAHKFDPIPHRDYYRLAAIFKGAFDEHDWLRPTRQSGTPGTNDRFLPYVTTEEREAWQAHQKQIQAEIDQLRAELKKQKGQPDSETAKKEKARLEQKIKELEGKKKTEPLIRALWDRGEPSPTYVLRRGNYLTPTELVQPGVPAVLTNKQAPFVVKPPWPGAKKSGRRLAFAKWLTDPGHPLTARVMVNRIWKHHFGQGIVTTLDNFGKAGARPTHPELLDWLVVEFVRSGWSIKHMHRLMLTSSVFRQRSEVTPRLERLDPENRLLSRMPLKRLEAEALRDTLLFVSGRLDERPFGPADQVKARGDGLVTSVGTDRGWRRSIYVLQRRTQIPTLLENFDLPPMSPNCVERSESVVAPQALHLLNNGFVHRLAEFFAQRIRSKVGTERAEQIEQIYLIAFGRRPTDEEQTLARESIERLARKWAAENNGGKNETKAASQAASRALTNFCHAVMNSAAFLYVD